MINKISVSKMDIPFIITIMYIFRGLAFPVETRDYSVTQYALIIIFTVKVLEYRCNKPDNVSKRRRFISCLFRVYNCMCQYMIWCSGWNWEKVISVLPLALGLALGAWFIPFKYIEKFYKNQTLVRTIILSEFQLIFAYAWLLGAEFVYERYYDNDLMFAALFFFIEGYPTVVIDTIETIVFHKRFPTYVQYLILGNYVPCIVAYLIYFKYENNGTFKMIDFTPSSGWDSYMLRTFTIVVFQLIVYYDMKVAGFCEDIWDQWTSKTSIHYKLLTSFRSVIKIWIFFSRDHFNKIVLI